MTSIEFEEVSKVFRDHRRRAGVALSGISLRVEDGETVVVVGPSGSGKSTLLRIAAGLESPTSGQVRLGSAVVNDRPPHRRHLAMMFQGAALVAHLTVRENLIFGLKFRRERGWRASFLSQWLSRAGAMWASRFDSDRVQELGALDISGRIYQVAKRLGLDQLLDRFPEQLSGGERQRVALGRAIVRDPAAFLFDEPLTGLDLRSRQELLGDISRQLRRSRATSIWVTHDQTEALALADRVAVLMAGRLVQCGPCQQVYENPISKSVAEFFGPFPVNWLSGKWFAGGQSRNGEPLVGSFVDRDLRLQWEFRSHGNRSSQTGDRDSDRLGSVNVLDRVNGFDSDWYGQNGEWVDLGLRPEWIEEYSSERSRHIDLGEVEIIDDEPSDRSGCGALEASSVVSGDDRVVLADDKADRQKNPVVSRVASARDIPWGGLGLEIQGVGKLVRFAACDNKPSRWCGWWFARRNIAVGDKVRLQVCASRVLRFAANSSENLVKVES